MARMFYEEEVDSSWKMEVVKRRLAVTYSSIAIRLDMDRHGALWGFAVTCAFRVFATSTCRTHQQIM
jgi:hypothetical protein